MWSCNYLPFRWIVCMGKIWSCVKPRSDGPFRNDITSSGVYVVFSMIVSSIDKIWSPTESAPHLHTNNLFITLLSFCRYPKQLCLPVSNARRQYASNKNASRTYIIFGVHCAGLQIGIIAENNAKLLVHWTLNFDEQRSQWKFNTLHHRHVIFDR